MYEEFSVFIFPQVFYPYFKLCIALCCVLRLKEMSNNWKCIYVTCVTSFTFSYYI